MGTRPASDASLGRESECYTQSRCRFDERFGDFRSAREPWPSGLRKGASMVAIEPEKASIAAEYKDFAHTGPDTLAGRYMRRFWQPVRQSIDLTAGRAKPIRIMSEYFTLYRGEGGAPHVV